MNVEFIAFESMGVRSQATFVQSKNLNIFIDPSAALAPRRSGLPPHVYEVEKLLEVFNVIEGFIKDSDMIVYTHYHYDHHDPGRFIDLELYKGKIIYLKDPQNNINVSQRIRASKFIKFLKDFVKDIRIADGRKEVFLDTVLRFSSPLPHGESYRLGYVVAVCIEEKDDTLMYTSDIEGGPLENHRNLLGFCRARVAVVDGPPTYLVGYKYSEESLRASISFLSTLLELESLEILVLDHHVCRDLNYINKMSKVLDKARNLNKKVRTAAEMQGLSPLLLEAMRRELYKEKPESGLNLLKSKYKGLKMKGLETLFGEE